MPFLVRKVERAKWAQNDLSNGDPVSADAITNCMKTRDNSLSVWEIEESEDLEKAVLAIASDGRHIDTMDFVILKLDDLENKRIEVSSEPASTPVSEFNSNHRNILKLNYGSLGTVAELIAKEHICGSVHRFTHGRLVQMLASAAASGLLSVDDLRFSDKKKEKIRKQIASFE